MKATLHFFLLLSGFTFSQNIDLNGTKWVNEHHQFLRFQKKSISLSDVSFLSGYRLNGNTIEFKHDFSYIAQITVGDKVIAREKYEVPNSRFKISFFSSDSIQFTALNPAAIYVASMINQKRNNLKEEQFIEWEKTGEQPKELRYQRLDSVITFVNYLTTKNERQISAIHLSTSCYNMDRKYYTDLVIDTKGFLHARTINQGYNNGSKPNFSYYEGQLNHGAFEKLDSLFSFSGMPDNATVSYIGWASHSTNFDLTIRHTKGTVYANGIETTMGELERKFFDAIQYLMLEEFAIKESVFVFEQSKFDADFNKK
jgi:hypothetical protein